MTGRGDVFILEGENSVRNLVRKEEDAPRLRLFEREASQADGSTYRSSVKAQRAGLREETRSRRSWDSTSTGASSRAEAAPTVGAAGGRAQLRARAIAPSSWERRSTTWTTSEACLGMLLLLVAARY